jgi:hypothetical protein
MLNMAVSLTFQCDSINLSAMVTDHTNSFEFPAAHRWVVSLFVFAIMLILGKTVTGQSV